MNANPEQLNGELHLFGFPKTTARVGVARHAPPVRARRALRALATFWAIAVLTILIPIAHLVLVPGFFVTGIVMALVKLNEPASVTGVSGICPRCGQERQFEAGGRLKASSQVTCPVCHNQPALTIDPAFVRGS
jgi:hypothetical protein